MMKPAILALITAFAAVPALAQTPPAVPPAMKALIDRQFSAIDADRNGTISRAEFDRYAQRRIVQQDREFEAAYVSLDTNADGKITLAEAKINPPLAQHFAAVDTNRDQAISRAELHAAMIAAQNAGLARD